MNGHVDKALEQIQQMQARVIENRKFHGWSGRTRIVSGVVALLVGVLLYRGVLAVDEYIHLACWAGLLVFSLLLNTSAMGLWFWRDPKVDRDIRKLRPLLDPLAPLGVGGLLSIALIIAGQWSLVVGVWAMHYGLANYALRKVLPKPVVYVALYYLSVGAACLIVRPSFLTPLVMGSIFFVGEVAGGCILHINQNRKIG